MTALSPLTPMSNYSAASHLKYWQSWTHRAPAWRLDMSQMQLFELEKEKSLPDVFPMYVFTYCPITILTDSVYRCRRKRGLNFCGCPGRTHCSSDFRPLSGSKPAITDDIKSPDSDAPCALINASSSPTDIPRYLRPETSYTSSPPSISSQPGSTVCSF